MYESVGYGTYDESDAFPNGIEAQLPVEGSVPRGWQPYEFEDSNEGYELAKVNLTSPLLNNEDNLANGKKCMKYIVQFVTVLKEMVTVY